jgi:hypothetical protein
MIVVAALAMGAGAAWASDAIWYDGNKLYTVCQYSQSDCFSYALGVMDADYMSRTLQHLEKTYCLPGNATTGRIADIVTNFLRDHPGERQYVASSLVMLAIKPAFPCP